MKSLLLVLCCATALAACAPKAEKTVAAIDPRTPPAGMTAHPPTLAQSPAVAGLDPLDADHDGVVSPDERRLEVRPPR